MAKKPERKFIEEVLKVISLHPRVFLIGTALFTIVAMQLALRIPLQYTSTAMFERRSDAATEHIDSGGSGSYSTAKLTLRQDMTGYAAVEKVAENLGMFDDLDRDETGQLTDMGVVAKERITNSIRNRLQVKYHVSSGPVDIVSVIYSHNNPDLAKTIPNRIVENYISTISQEIIDRLRSSEEFLISQVEKCKAELLKLNKERIQLEVKYGSIVLDDPVKLADYTRKLKDEIDLTQRRLELAEDKLARLRSMSAASPVKDRSVDTVSANGAVSVEGDPAGETDAQDSGINLAVDVRPAGNSVSSVVMIPNPELKELRQRLDDLQTRLEEALYVKHQTEEHPDVQMINRNIMRLTQKINQTPTETVLHKEYNEGAMSASLTAQIAIAESDCQAAQYDLERLQRELGQFTEDRKDIGPVRQEYDQLNEQIKEEQDELNKWRNQLNKIKIDLEGEYANRRTHMSTIRAAKNPSRAVSPSLLMVMVFAIGGGLAFGYGLTLIGNIFGQRISTGEDAGSWFDIPVHGVIGEIVDKASLRSMRVRKTVISIVIAILLVGGLFVSTTSVVLRLNYPEKYEAWKGLLTNVIDNAGATDGDQHVALVGNDENSSNL